MATRYSPAIVTSGLSLCLDAANKVSYLGSGTSWYNLSGTIQSGSLKNGPTFSRANLGTIVFDGTDDYVNLGDILNFGTGDFSYEVYVSYNNLGVGAAGATMSKDNYSGTSTYKGITLNISTGISFETRNIVSGVGPDTICNWSSSELLIGNWYCVHANRASNVLRLYVNGILRNTTNESIATDVTNTQEMRIGSLSNTSPQRLNGKIANVKVYNRALSATEVLQNYNATKTRFGL